MTAVTYANTKLEVVDQPTPAPAKRQLLIDVLRCGICGSDLPRATLYQIPDHRRRLLQGRIRS
jgi:threonine dehydrogenase-like Zn-dependent dehydrogenase